MGKKEELRDSIRRSDLRYSPLNGVRFDIVSADDEITFKCHHCGKCCKGRDTDKILASPLDIYNGAKYLGITTDKFIENYIDFHTGASSCMLVGSLKADYKGTCKLLTYEGSYAKCMIHSKKPLICALHPLGLIHGDDCVDEDGNDLYIFVEPCKISGKTGEKMKVSEITDNLPGTKEEIEMAAEIRSMHKVVPKRIAFYKGVLLLAARLTVLNLSDEEMREIQEGGFSKGFLDACAENRNELEKILGHKIDLSGMLGKTIDMYKEMLDAFEDANYEYSYHKYDTSRPFLEQCKENYEAFKEFIELFAKAGDSIAKELTGELSEEKQKEFDKLCMKMEGQ